MKTQVITAIAIIAVFSVVFHFLPRDTRGGLVSEKLPVTNPSGSATESKREELKHSQKTKDELMAEDDALAAIQEAQVQVLAALSNIESRLEKLDARVDLLENSPEESVGSTDVADDLFPEEDHREAFIAAEEMFYSQGYDPAWDAEMTRSLNEVQSVIDEFSDGAITMTHQECRQDACRVVLSSDGTGPGLYPVLLSAQGSSHMIFDHYVEDGVDKTVVIYQR